MFAGHTVQEIIKTNNRIQGGSDLMVHIIQKYLFQPALVFISVSRSSFRNITQPEYITIGLPLIVGKGDNERL